MNEISASTPFVGRHSQLYTTEKLSPFFIFSSLLSAFLAADWLWNHLQFKTIKKNTFSIEFYTTDERPLNIGLTEPSCMVLSTPIYTVPFQKPGAAQSTLKMTLWSFCLKVQSEIKRKWRSWTVNRYFAVDLKQQRHPSLASSGVNGGTQLSILSKSSSQIRMSSPLAENANISLPTWARSWLKSTSRCRSTCPSRTQTNQSRPKWPITPPKLCCLAFNNIESLWNHSAGSYLIVCNWLFELAPPYHLIIKFSRLHKPSLPKWSWELTTVIPASTAVGKLSVECGYCHLSFRIIYKWFVPKVTHLYVDCRGCFCEK